MTGLTEYPHRLADVADPCTEEYYPNWSARGMRPVRCTRPAKANVTRPSQGGGTTPIVRRVCRIHGKSWERSGFPVTWGDPR